MKSYRSRSWATKLALWLGLIFGSIWVFTFFTGAILEKEQITGEGVLLAVLVSLIILGVIFAMWLGKIGGILVIIFSVAFCIFAYATAGRNKLFAVLISGVPFIISGILFLLGFKMEQNK